MHLSALGAEGGGEVADFSTHTGALIAVSHVGLEPSLCETGGAALT